MKNQFLRLSLCLGVLVMAPVARGQFTFTTNNGAITITGYNTAAGLNAVIPASTNGHSVTTIGNDAFNNSSITNVTIPNSVTTIGSAAFENCKNLASVTIGNGVTTIGNAAFNQCTNLASVTIPNSVTNLDNGAFSDCTSLRNVTIGSGVTSIGTYPPFFDCNSLTNITVAAANPAYSSLNGVLFDKAQTTLIQYAAGLTNKNYTIPNSVTNIGSQAFYFCTSLMSVTIGSGATTIGEGAFYSCTSLTNITVAAANPAYSSLNGVLFDKARTTLLQFPGGLGGGYTIPNSVAYIGDNSFQNCIGLTSVVIPNSVTTIGFDAFFDCYGLTNVTIPSSVTGIGDQAFTYCYFLTNITFQGNAPSLGGNGVFFSVDAGAKVYYFSDTTGWGSSYGGLPAVQLIRPQIGNSRVLSGNFVFTLTGTNNQTLVVEACTNLLNWQPVWTNTLSGTSIDFTDPEWTNYPQRFYRAR